MRKRQSIRLKHHNYSDQGYYFVTICVQNRLQILSRIVGDDPRAGSGLELSPIGQMAQSGWLKLPERFSGIELDEFIIMPNHLHGIIAIEEYGHSNVGAPLVGAHSDRAGTRPAPTIGYIVGAFKSITTVEYVRGVRQRKWPPFEKRFWQRGYFERVIRNEKELLETRQYIRENPLKWEMDPENPSAHVHRAALFLM